MNWQDKIIISVPVNPVKRKEDAGEVLLEKISFFHDYNSRQDPLMPKKGKVCEVVLVAHQS